jgi:hypothetical protein
VIDRLDADSPEVQRFLAELAALPETTTAEPSPELAALLGGEPLARARSGPRRATGWLVAVVAAVALLVGAVGTGWAAAANQLPSPLQDAIADFSEHHLPFRVPHSSDDGRDGAPGVEKQGLPVDRPAPRLLQGRTPTRHPPVRPAPDRAPQEGPASPAPSPTATGSPTTAGTPGPSQGSSPSPAAPSESPAPSPSPAPAPVPATDGPTDSPSPAPSSEPRTPDPTDGTVPAS